MLHVGIQMAHMLQLLYTTPYSSFKPSSAKLFLYRKTGGDGMQQYPCTAIPTSFTKIVLLTLTPQHSVKYFTLLVVR